MPGFMSLAGGRVSDLREVGIADLLGRDAKSSRQVLFERCIRGQVLVDDGVVLAPGTALIAQ